MNLNKSFELEKPSELSHDPASLSQKISELEMPLNFIIKQSKYN